MKILYIKNLKNIPKKKYLVAEFKEINMNNINNNCSNGKCIKENNNCSNGKCIIDKENNNKNEIYPNFILKE